MKLVHYTHKPYLKLKNKLGEWFGFVCPQKPDFKPRGLWVSDDDAEQNWKTWSEAESFRLECLRHAHDVELSANANILYITNHDQLVSFTRAFEKEISPDLKIMKYIDWSIVAQHYQGIIITPYLWECRMGMDTFWYYGWDCASGCIWDFKAIVTIKLRQPAQAA